jgi:hypothetical protein
VREAAEQELPMVGGEEGREREVHAIKKHLTFLLVYGITELALILPVAPYHVLSPSPLVNIFLIIMSTIV